MVYTETKPGWETGKGDRGCELRYKKQSKRTSTEHKVSQMCLASRRARAEESPYDDDWLTDAAAVLKPVAGEG